MVGITSLPESGYVALLTVLMTGATATAIVLVLLVSGTDSQRSTLVGQQSKQARVASVACAQEALQLIHDNIAYTGTGGLTLLSSTCSYEVNTATPTTRSIAVTATAGTVTRKISAQATIAASSISISSWQEIV